ncbi:DUF4157 domain-containing protein [Nostoc sp. ChiSLP03a]|uniref:eCIS core domain-containing protein n=1 Tax=Nostoc sp. ChiSLP03a TaxID=3075380 RepID=UPI002AD20B58|nr:DUF4157 domain-containing protein [Nostoc sp. ChiSLP03a]MDZ8215965.1 DUF4157 domain-containing protein [Nostoc sp. ChiSLP03a]
MREHVSRQKKTTTGFSIPSLKHPTRGFGLESSAISRQAVPEIQPLHKPVTHDISRIPLRTQAKLSISQPGDKYEQEADSVAQQVMQTMAQPGNPQSIQREALPEDEEELQMKPLDISTLQREALPEDEEELQMKSLDNRTLQREEVPEDDEELQMKLMVQPQGEASIAAAPDLETSINQARSGGQSMADNIREPMEVAFGADFSRVKVHTDGQSDQLNRSIQARAFTTGQDVFFRSGEYNPGSRGGQELLAHELTHVVQQNGGAVMRSPLLQQQLSQHPVIKTPSALAGDRTIQLNGDEEDQGIAGRVRSRADYNRMTKRQKELYGGIDGDRGRQSRRDAVSQKREADRVKLLERNRRHLWDNKTRPSFTPDTWNTMLESVESKQRGNIIVYECEDGTYCPLKSDRIGKEPYVTLDHKKNWKEYIYDNAQPEDDGEIAKKSASDAYNDTNNLVVMSNVRNSAKNGPKGMFD